MSRLLYFAPYTQLTGCLLVALGLWGCPEAPTAVDFGTAGESTPIDIGMSGDDGVTEGCFEDLDCSEGQYCAREDDSSGQCREGCKDLPESCRSLGERFQCDTVTRQCVQRCVRDDECPDSAYCNGDICREGCRVTEAGASSCPPLEDQPQLCNPDSRSCEPAWVCCDLEDACSITDEISCNQVGGDLLYGVLSCQPDPCPFPCNRDSECADGQYCSDYGRCITGCRPSDSDGCPTDLTCDPESRRCARKNCDEDAICPDWQFCARDGQCRDGCREGNCPEGLRCDSQHVCRAFCEEDDECAENQYCELSSGDCRSSCDPVTHQGCRAGEACLEGRCEIGCADDPFELLDDQTQESAPLLEWTIGEEGGVRATGSQSRVLCEGDVDWARFRLEEDERFELSLTSRPSSGPIQVSVLNAQGEQVLVSELWESIQNLRYPRLGESAPAGDYWVHVSDQGLIEAHPYTLELRVAPQAQACFSDADDPEDDTTSGARPFGLTPALRFTEFAAGDLCFGDRDFYCFPMSISDGLDVRVSAPVECDPLEVKIAPSAIFDLPETEFEGYILSLNELSSEYSIFLDPESNLFTNDEWCARISSEGLCEGYELSATFTRRQLLCSDLREPNNSLSQATLLDGAGPLADGTGRIPVDQELALMENLQICQGDRDLFQVNPEVGDAWRVWLVDDSDPVDEPLRGRGQLVGQLKVRFLNDQGSQIGDSALINPAPVSAQPDQEPLQVATALSASNEPLFIEVSGIEDSAGPYLLFIERVEADGECSQDVNEPEGRDDELSPVSQLREETPNRYTVSNGYLCDPEGQFDEDWYSFEVMSSSTRMCLNALFRHRDGDVNIELFQLGNSSQGQICNSHASCRMNQAASSCISGRCRTPVARAQSLDDNEMLHFSELETQVGLYYARVYSPIPVENAYQLGVTLVPQTGQCEDDVHEGATGNNRSQNATQLGSGRIALCDAWICENERTPGDWYEVVVPASAERTIFVEFESQQGRLTLSVQDNSRANGELVESPRSQSRNVHCINVKGGPRPAILSVQIAGDVLNINQQRIDYLFHVVPTDLSVTPRGACDQLGGGLFNTVQWPTLDLSD